LGYLSVDEILALLDADQEDACSTTDSDCSLGKGK
jgi:hypothetical protein